MRLPFRLSVSCSSPMLQLRPSVVSKECSRKTSARKATLCATIAQAAGAFVSRSSPTTWPKETDAAVWRIGRGVRNAVRSRNIETPAVASAPDSIAATMAETQPGSGYTSESMKAMISPAARSAPLFLST